MRNLMPDNPFEIVSDGVKQILKHQDQECFLAGIHIDTEPLANNVDALMAYMKGKRNNFYRHWMIAYYNYDNPGGRQHTPFKFANGQWDLSKYNVDYFNRLKSMLNSARKNGVIVQLTLFDKSGMIKGEGRWINNPWNASSDPDTHPVPNNINGVINRHDEGLPEFFTQATPGSLLANLQINYVRKVVKETREFPNVIYEIMNEPINPSDETLAVWANTMVNVIAPLVQGRRLIFYNSHRGFPSDTLSRLATDVKHWKANASRLTGYDRFDGVILHGNPKRYDPTNFAASGWDWARDKLLQGSSDAFDAIERDKYTFNKETTDLLFGRRQLFQAESTDDEAAKGIRDAAPLQTTIFKLPPFLGCWDKTSSQGPHFNLRFDGKGRFQGFDPVEDRIIVQGKLLSFTDNTFTVRRDGVTTNETFTYNLSGDRQTLTYTGSYTQVFVRMLFDYEPFLFGWQKFFESTPSPFPNFLMYFGRHANTLVTTVRDPANPANIIDQGKVLEFQTDTAEPTIKVFSQLMNASPTYKYDFYYDAQRQPCLMLENIQNHRRQDFRRTI